MCFTSLGCPSTGTAKSTACLSLVGVQLTADSVGPAKLLLQLARALHVHSVVLFQEAHLSAQVSQVLQLPLVRLHHRLELVHPVRRVPEGEGKHSVGGIEHQQRNMSYT